MGEFWKPVVGYENKYEVSSFGRIKNIVGKVLKVKRNWAGYCYIGLFLGGKRKFFSIHRLVLFAFYGTPKVGQEANHKNGKRDDNRLCNLEWVTRGVNHRHKYKVLKARKPQGELHGQAKLTDNDIYKIRLLLEEDKFSQKQVAEFFNVSASNISRICRRERWAHI